MSNLCHVCLLHGRKHFWCKRKLLTVGVTQHPGSTQHSANDILRLSLFLIIWHGSLHFSAHTTAEEMTNRHRQCLRHSGRVTVDRLMEERHRTAAPCLSQSPCQETTAGDPWGCPNSDRPLQPASLFCYTSQNPAPCSPQLFSLYPQPPPLCVEDLLPPAPWRLPRLQPCLLSLTHPVWASFPLLTPDPQTFLVTALWFLHFSPLRRPLSKGPLGRWQEARNWPRPTCHSASLCSPYSSSFESLGFLSLAAPVSSAFSWSFFLHLFHLSFFHSNESKSSH